jgi:hypothetical protein
LLLSVLTRTWRSWRSLGAPGEHLVRRVPEKADFRCLNLKIEFTI